MPATSRTGIYDMVAARPELEHVVLMCPAVNEIDASALESLEAINLRLKEAASPSTSPR
jgi:sulfate permease, SulP family